MASIEMHSFTRDMQPLMDEAASNLTEEKVNTAFGQVKVSIYGDPKDSRKVPMITFHDLGLDCKLFILSFLNVFVHFKQKATSKTFSNSSRSQSLLTNSASTM